MCTRFIFGKYYKVWICLEEDRESAASVYGGHFVNRMPAREGDVNWNYCGDQA